MPPFPASLVRTWAPIVAGWLIGLPVAPALLGVLGVDTATARDVAATAVSSALAAGYYLAVRLLERRWPALGVLLGHAAQPTSYTTAAGVRQVEGFRSVGGSARS